MCIPKWSTHFHSVLCAWNNIETCASFSWSLSVREYKMPRIRCHTHSISVHLHSLSYTASWRCPCTIETCKTAEQVMRFSLFLRTHYVILERQIRKLHLCAVLRCSHLFIHVYVILLRRGILVSGQPNLTFSDWTHSRNPTISEAWGEGGVVTEQNGSLCWDTYSIGCSKTCFRCLCEWHPDHFRKDR